MELKGKNHVMLSYSRGPDEELWELTIGQVLDRTVERWGAFFDRDSGDDESSRFVPNLWIGGLGMRLLIVRCCVLLRILLR
jgi:hypothetical protein